MAFFREVTKVDSEECADTNSNSSEEDDADGDGDVTENGIARGARKIEIVDREDEGAGHKCRVG